MNDEAVHTSLKLTNAEVHMHEHRLHCIDIRLLGSSTSGTIVQIGHSQFTWARVPVR